MGLCDKPRGVLGKLGQVGHLENALLEGGCFRIKREDWDRGTEPRAHWRRWRGAQVHPKRVLVGGGMAGETKGALGIR